MKEEVKSSFISDDIFNEVLKPKPFVVKDEEFKKWRDSFSSKCYILNMGNQMKVQEITTVEEIDRVETGPLRINDDWCGVYVRGDNAFALGMELDRVIKKENNPMLFPLLMELHRAIKNMPR